MENRVRQLSNSLIEYYEIPLEYIKKITNKSYQYKDETSKEYFLKVSHNIQLMN